MKKLSIIILLAVLVHQEILAQDSTRTSKFSVFASVGPNLYINNFDQFKKFVDGSNYSLALRVMWEPEHRLSIGLKTGYYRIYTVNFTGVNSGKFTLTAIPIQPFITMQLFKGFYAFYGMGPSLYFNKITSSAGELLNDSFLSLADISTGIGYLRRLKNKVSFGAEAEYFHSSKSDENLITVSFVTRVPLSIFSKGHK